MEDDLSSTGTPLGASNESAFTLGAFVNDAFGLADTAVPAFFQYKTAQTRSQATGPLPTSLGLGSLGGNSGLLILGGAVLVIVLLLRK